MLDRDEVDMQFACLPPGAVTVILVVVLVTVMLVVVLVTVLGHIDPGES